MDEQEMVKVVKVGGEREEREIPMSMLEDYLGWGWVEAARETVDMRPAILNGGDKPKARRK